MAESKLGTCDCWASHHGNEPHERDAFVQQSKTFGKINDCVNWREQPAQAEPTKEAPIYTKFRHDEGKYNHNYSGTPRYGISCNEGWRESIVCTNMYDWAADWLLSVLERKPYAPEKH